MASSSRRLPMGLNYPDSSNCSPNEVTTAKSSDNAPLRSTATKTPAIPTSYGPLAAKAETVTMDISLEEVKLAQVFHHADGRSVKGICFDYKDGEKASIGCCEAEPGAWSGFVKPECFLFKIRLGHYVGEAFFPVEDISFANMDDQPGTFTHCIHMEDSVAFRLSPDGLEIDIRYEKMMKAPYRCKRTAERVKDALKGWVTGNPIVARLRKKLCRKWKIPPPSKESPLNRLIIEEG